MEQIPAVCSNFVEPSGREYSKSYEMFLVMQLVVKLRRIV